MSGISEVLAQYGDIDRDAAIELASVADLCRQTLRKGKVTLTFSIEPKGGRVLVAVATATTPPKSDAEVHLWHVGPDGLTQDEPHQVRIDTTTGDRDDDGRIVEPAEGWRADR